MKRRTDKPVTPGEAAATPTLCATPEDGAVVHPMYIGELVRRTGASAKAVRLYETLGLLGRVPRLGVYRVYNERHVRQVGLIRQAQSLGVRLGDMHGVLGPASAAQPDWDAVAQQVLRQRTQVAQEIRRLQALLRNLDAIGEELRQCSDDA